MTCRGMKLNSDIDAVAYASDADIETVLKKFIVTKNVKPETALRWALQRATTEAERELVRKKYAENYASGAGLID